MRRSAWRAFPTVARVKVWIDDRDSIRRGLSFYNPASLAGRVAKTLAVRCPKGLFQLACRSKPDLATRELLETIAAIIRKRLGDQVLAISLSPGVADKHQKITAQVSGDAGVLSYVKVAHTSEATRLLENEARRLEWLADKDMGSAAVPKVIGFDQANGLTLLFQSPPPVSTRPRSIVAPDRKDAVFLTALMATDRKSVSLAALLQDWRQTVSLDYEKSADDALDKLRHEVESALVATLPTQQVMVSASHGDYTPWNCLNLSDGRLFVFDWEYGHGEAPLLGDLFHRILMPARVLRRTPPHKLIPSLFMKRGSHVWDVVESSGIPRSEIPAYLLIYLMQMAERDRAQQGMISPYVKGCLRAGLGAIQDEKG